MKFLVIEIQKGKDGKIANLVTAHDRINDAQAKYHTILAAAAKSGLPSHAAVILEENGSEIAHECYVNEKEPEEGANE